MHLTATIRHRQATANSDSRQIEVDADTYADAKQAVLDQLDDGWIVTAYRVDRPTPAS